MAHHINKRELAKSSSWNLITSIIARAGTLIFTAILARILLPEKFGIYSIVISLVVIISTVFEFGINQSLVKFFSENTHKDRSHAYAYYDYLQHMKIQLSLASALFLAIISYPISRFVFHNVDGLFLPLMFSSLYLFVMSLDSFYMHLYYSFKKIDFIAIREVINQILKIGLLVGAFMFLEQIDPLHSTIFVISIASFFSVAYLIYHKKKFMKRGEKYQKQSINKKEILQFAFFIALANVVNSLLFYLDSLILGVFVGPEYVGFYKAAFSLVLGVAGIGMAPVLIILPYLLEADAKDQERITLMYLKLVALFAIPASFGMMMLGSYLLVLLFGPAYSAAYYSLVLLSFVIFPQIVVSALFFNICSARNAPRLFFRQIVYTTVLNVFLNIAFLMILISYSELAAMIGASVASLISWVYYFISTSFILRKEFDMHISYTSVLTKPILASIIMSLGIYAALRQFSSPGAFGIVVLIVLGVALYFVSVYISGFVRHKDIKRVFFIFKEHVKKRNSSQKNALA